LTATLDRIDRLDRFYTLSSRSIAKVRFTMRKHRKGGGDVANRTASSMDCR